MRKIEIEFPFDVEPLDGFEHVLFLLIDTMICKPYERANPSRVMWPAEHGSKPHYSIADSAFLGKPVETGAPASGEPSYDDDIYCIEIAEREASEKELQRRQKT